MTSNDKIERQLKESAITWVSPATRTPVMFTAHLHIDDRRYAGCSDYRPGEGWIEVTDYGFGPGNSREAFVTILDERVAPLLHAAVGKDLGGAVLDARHESDRVRYTLTDILVAGVAHGGGNSNSVRLTLNFAKLTWTEGKGT
jgi:hypothetical protein